MADGANADGRQRLLRATLDHLESRSEADLRVVDIAREAGVAIGLIRHHFGSREGLISAAQQIRLEGAVKVDLALSQDVLASAKDRDALLEAIHGLTLAILDPDRHAIRLGRVAVLGAAHGRPELQKVYAATIKALIDELAVLVLRAQVAGLARDDLDPRGVATFIQSYALGMILHDLDTDGVAMEAMAEVIMAAVRGLFVTDAP